MPRRIARIEVVEDDYTSAETRWRVTDMWHARYGYWMPKLRVVESGICDVWRGFERSVERFWFLFVGRVRRGFCALGGVGLGTAGFAGAPHCCPDFPMCVAEGVAALSVCLCCSPRFVSRPMSYQDWPKLARCTMISLELCLLYLQEQTFSWPPLTSGFDPTRTSRARLETSIRQPRRPLARQLNYPQIARSTPNRMVFLIGITSLHGVALDD